MPGTLDDSSCVSPTPTTSSSVGGSSGVGGSGNGDGLHDSRHDYNGRSWSRHSRSSSALDRHSESSESLDNQSTSSGTGGRPMHDFSGSSEFIPTRSTKASPKVAYNPMQFVKTGPAKLVNTAYEQLRKAEEVKKVRETRKDEAEDWQSNLEGWKSNRRKRQEHVIERVTEVKRMEQEEALKASEAAAKRLMGIREKRGKLSALYSVEDDNEIAFDLPPPSETDETLVKTTKTTTTTTTVSQQSFSRNDDHREERDETETLVTSSSLSSTTTTVTKTLGVGEEAGDERTTASVRPDSREYTYDKAIEQYVKYSTSALSKQEVHSETRTVSVTEDVVTAKAAPLVDARRGSGDASSVSVKPSGSSDELVKKRAIFERSDSSAAEAEDANSSRASAIALANRRSGEFSSTFKSRLSTFETESLAAAASSSEPAKVVAPDPQFKTKLATFHRAATGGGVETEAKKEVPVAVTADQDEKPDFKARLAAFRQVEETMKASEVAPPAKPKPVQIGQPAKPPVPAVKPVVKNETPPLPPPPPPPPPHHHHHHQQQQQQLDNEPIYANSSVALGYQEAEQAAESSDCTEDEGIRSLSPHGTPSPTSPTRTEPAIESQSNAFSSFHSFNGGQQQQHQQQPSPPSELPAAPATATTGGSGGDSTEKPGAWSHESEVVWDDWVDLGSVPKAAPPTEKPPPPPLDDDPSPMTITTPATPATPTTPTIATSPVGSEPPESPSFANQVTTRKKEAAADSDVRKELRKRRSDFLGFDVNAMENDAKELADAIPPPPDLKSLVKSATDYQWQAPRPAKESPVERATTDDEEALARKEREIIETLEKEERMKAAHNTSGDGIEFEMTAEIDQLAREWRNDAVLGPGWRASAKIQPFQPQQQQQPDEHKIVPQKQQQPLQVDVNSPRHDAVPMRSPASPKVVASPLPPPPPPPPQQQPSPPKPSRLSAAPKPRFHDGEAWMAKRKVASEAGGQKKDMKDVSRHWLIQEAEQRRIDAMQERNYSPSSSSSVVQLSATSPVRPGPASSGSASIDGNAWMSRSSSSTSVDKMSELRLPKDQSRSASSLGSSPTPRPLYANQEEILEYADFTGAPHANPPVWQVRSIVSSSSMDQLQSIHSMHQQQVPPSRPAKMSVSKSQTLPPASSLPVQSNPAQTQPSWRSTHPPETEKEPIPPLPHSVIHTLTQRVSQRNVNNINNNNNNNNNYGDYMNVQEATAPSSSSSFARAGPQVPPQRPANYRHPSLGQQTPPMTNSAVQPPVLPPNNNDRMLSVSGKKKCSLCQDELGRGAAMIIESLRLFYHINCFRCCVCGIALGNGTAGTDVRVRNNNLHCHDCYSNDDGLKFSKV